MQAVHLSRAGGPEVLEIVELDLPVPQPGEVLIEVHCAGVNRPDLAQRAGKYPPPPGASPILGLEVAGIIRQVGHQVKQQVDDQEKHQVSNQEKQQVDEREKCQVGDESKLKVGDAVCALVPGGGYAEFCTVPERHCLPLPSGWSFTEAAGIPETFFTVWANLFQMGKLLAGQTVLIHGGASGIGTTAIQLANAFGADVIVTAGTDEKCYACLQLGALAAINYKKADFEKQVARLTDGHGVDVVLDMVGGPYTAKNMQCLAQDGRLCQIATMQGATVSIDLRLLMQKRLLLTGSMMRPRSIEEKASIAQELLGHVWPLLAARRVKVIVDKVFPFAQVKAAHEFLEAGDHFGKVILQLK